MSLPAALCLELLGTGKDLIGAAYPKRTLDMKKLRRKPSQGGWQLSGCSEPDLRLHSQDTRGQDVQDGLLSVRG